jgi:Rad3-related DNA helicase
MDLGELGLQKHFKQLRPQQEYALEKLQVSPSSVDVTALPTGVGKSLLAVVYAKLTGLRSVILTSTKALQDQYQRDFPGLVDVRGMSNYPCRDLEGKAQCDVGKCLDGEHCVWKEAGCAYFDRLRYARDAQILVTNYKMWFTHRHDAALGPRELVICDEAHELGAELGGAVGVELRPHEVHFQAGMESWDLQAWREWSREKHRTAKRLLEHPSTTPFERQKLRSLERRLERLSWATDWAWDYIPGRLVRFEPIDLTPFSKGYLTRGAAKTVLMSATVKPFMVEALGLGDFNYLETDSPFPVAHRPIIWLEVGVRLSSKTSERNLSFWANKIDQVLDRRLDRKGIIHTVSYRRAQYLQRHSRHRQHFLLHDPENTQETVQRFKRMEAPAILVSPSVHTGHDFPYDQAAWQVIAKIPFPDTRSGIARARQERDSQWNVKFAATTLVQMAGRVVRAEDDLGETIITDDNVKWLLSRYKPLFSRWFREAYRTSATVPDPWWKEGR